MSLWSCRGWVQGLWHAGCFWAGGCSKAELSLPSPSPARQIPTMFWKEMLGPSGYALWGDEAAIYVGLVAFLLCSCYSFLSDKRTDSICWATALISEASGVTQIYFGLSEGGMWPRETRDRKIWRWESYGTCSENIPGFQAGWALSILVQATWKWQKIWSFLIMPWKSISHSDQSYLNVFPVLPFNFV